MEPKFQIKINFSLSLNYQGFYNHCNSKIDNKKSIVKLTFEKK